MDTYLSDANRIIWLGRNKVKIVSGISGDHYYTHPTTPVDWVYLNTVTRLNFKKEDYGYYVNWFA